MRRRVYVIFGGRSGEHEVSLMSAQNVMNALDPHKYEAVPVGITKAGKWLLVGDPLPALTQGVEASPGVTVSLPGDPTAPGFIALPDQERPSETLGHQQHWSSTSDTVPVFFPVLHGPYGEDGTIQGLLELAGVPYVGCGVLASAAGMDKAVAKALFRQAGLAVVPDVVIPRARWEQDRPGVTDEIEQRLGYPCFVKPASLGSSVGVSKAKDRAGLVAGLDAACRFDRKVLVEAAVDAREIEVAVLGNDAPQASLPGEVVPGNEFYDYQDKYFDGKAQLLIPAPLAPEQVATVRQLAVRAFQAVDGAGLARVDFFLDRRNGQFAVNEINTIPGFTRASMYPKLWEATGLGYGALLDRLIELALDRYHDQQRTQKTL